MSIVKGLIDRIIFTLGVLLFMQAPHFIDQYEQRLGGYYQAQLSHLQRYQQIADQQHRGSLSALIEEFESSNQRSVQHTGKNIREIDSQVQQLKTDVDVLANNSFVSKLSYLVTTVKLDIAQAVIKSFKPAMPLSTEAVICGLTGGVLLSLLFNLCFSFPRIPSRKNKQTKKNNVAHAKQRVEPTIMRPTRAV